MLSSETDPELGREDDIDVVATNRSSGGMLRSSLSGQIIEGSIPITLSAPKSNEANFSGSPKTDSSVEGLNNS